MNFFILTLSTKYPAPPLLERQDTGLIVPIYATPVTIWGLRSLIFSSQKIITELIIVL